MLRRGLQTEEEQKLYQTNMHHTHYSWHAIYCSKTTCTPWRRQRF